MTAPISEVAITVAERDVSDRVVFAQTSFQVSAGAQPGSCQITLRGPFLVNEFIAGQQICLYVDGRKMWWGYVFTVEQSYVFPDDPEARIVLRGPDLNILFDKLYMYNRTHETWYPDGGGAYKRTKQVGSDGKVTGYIVVVPPKTSDRDYIWHMLHDFDLDLVSPTIQWGQDVPSDSRIDEIAEINAGDYGPVWTPPSAGITLRGFFQDVAANVLRSEPGSVIFYIDPEGYIVWREQDYEWSKIAVGDAEGAVPTKNLSVTTDVSRLKNDVLVFTGTLDPTPQSTQEFLLFVHKINNPSVNQFGRFQSSEVMGSDWMKPLINARANKVLTQEGTPAMRAEFTIYTPGLYPGQIVQIWSSAHTFMLYDPTFGFRQVDSIPLPIRAIDMSFPTPDTVEYRVTASYDTQDPWGLLLALKRPATRGLVQPQFQVIDMSNAKQEYTYVEGQPMALVKEWPEPLSGSKWQCSYAYVRNSMTVVVKGLRKFAVPEAATSAVGFIETDPNNGIFFCDAGRPYVEYHVWHNLE